MKKVKEHKFKTSIDMTKGEKYFHRQINKLIKEIKEYKKLKN